jgi:hypothetical protein
MPRVSQLIIRTALIWLAAGYTAGGLLLLKKGVPCLPWLRGLRASHIHMLLVGWTVQLACGVAFWILPRLDAGGSRGDERLIWVCYVALNAGVALGAVLGPLEALSVGRVGWLYVLVGGLYFIAAACFVVHAWPRIRPFRPPPVRSNVQAGDGEP